MSFLQLALSLDKTIKGNNSIMNNLSIWPISQQQRQRETTPTLNYSCFWSQVPNNFVFYCKFTTFWNHNRTIFHEHSMEYSSNPWVFWLYSFVFIECLVLHLYQGYIHHSQAGILWQVSLQCFTILAEVNMPHVYYVIISPTRIDVQYLT